VHGDSSQDGSERSLGSPEGQCSIGFQPVFFRTERSVRSWQRCSAVEDLLRGKRAISTQASGTAIGPSSLSPNATNFFGTGRSKAISTRGASNSFKRHSFGEHPAQYSRISGQPGNPGSDGASPSYLRAWQADCFTGGSSGRKTKYPGVALRRRIR
jgi:hypothetical protein